MQMCAVCCGVCPLAPGDVCVSTAPGVCVMCVCPLRPGVCVCVMCPLLQVVCVMCVSTDPGGVWFHAPCVVIVMCVCPLLRGVCCVCVVCRPTALLVGSAVVH